MNVEGRIKLGSCSGSPESEFYLMLSIGNPRSDTTRYLVGKFYLMCHNLPTVDKQCMTIVIAIERLVFSFLLYFLLHFPFESLNSHFKKNASRK